MGRLRKGHARRRSDVWAEAGGKENIVHQFLKADVLNRDLGYSSNLWSDLSWKLFDEDSKRNRHWLWVIWTQNRNGVKDQVVLNSPYDPTALEPGDMPEGETKEVMALHPSKEDALLAWLNGLQLDEPVQRILQLQDGILLLKLVNKLKGEGPSQAPVHLPQAERLSIISDFLHSVCPVECNILTLSKGRMLELQLTKVVLLLCYYGLANNSLVVEFETELQMVAMLRSVQQKASGLCLCEDLDKLLTTSSLIYTSSVSSTSSVSEDGSPSFPQARSSPLVSFAELDTVASSSFVGSTLQELMSTPQVQVKRLRKELAHEGDVQDELEGELAERIALLSAKEGQASQLQHRLQRLQRDQEEMEKEHKATLTELQQKNEGLLTRVHTVLKQCRDLKTDNSQKERQLDELMEENGTLAAQVRNSFAQLARAEEEVAKITEAHNSSQTEWGNRRDLLQRELSQAITDRECLSEQIQISQGKISVLEDELAKLSQQPQEKGEVLGPIVEEKLKQELTDLTQKLSKLEETISLLKKEKMSLRALLAEERSSFEKETLRLEGRISDLQQSIKNMQAEKDAQEQASRTTQETLTSQIAALETDLAHLQQLEVHITAEIATSAELRQQRGMLEAKVTSLDDMVNMLEAENATRQEVLNAIRADLQNAQISLVEYEKTLADHQKVVEENASLRARISVLDDTITNLQTEIDAQRKRGDELLTANEQQKALMEEKFQKQEQKAHEMFAELETLSQELHRMKHQKLEAKSCVERLVQEGADLKAILAEQQDRGQSQLILVTKAKDAREMELQQIITDHQNEISELQTNIEGTELTVLKEKNISKDGELRIQQKELSDLQYKADDLQRQLSEVEGLSQHLSQDVVSKDREVQHVKAELEQREGEIQTLKVNLQSLEAKSSEMRDLHQKEIEKQTLAIMELKLQLSEAEKLISEKVQSLQALAQELKGLKEELSIERQRVVTLRLEVTQLQQEIDGHLKKLEESLNKSNSLKEELSWQQYLAFQRESEVSVLAARNKSLEEDFAQLQNKLAEAITLATKLQTDLLKLQEEVQHQENLRAKVQEVEKAQCKELQREVTELQARVQKLTSLASEREMQLGALNEKMKEQEEYNQKRLQKSDETLQKELENVVDLKGQLESAKNQTAVKNELLESTEEKLKQMELMYQQKVSLISETCQAKEALERRVNELCSKQKQDLDTFQQGLETLEKEKEHLSLINESLQSECLALQTKSKEQQDTSNAFKADLQSTQDRYERDIEALKKETELLQDKCWSLQTENKGQEEALNTLTANLQKTQDRYQKDVEIMKKENEHLSSVNQSLQIECQTLRAKETIQQEEFSALKADLQENKEKFEKDMEILKNERDQLSSVNQSLLKDLEAAQKVGAELVSVKEVTQQREHELENQVKEIQVKIKEISSLAEEREAEIRNLHSEVKQQEVSRLRAEESEKASRAELEAKVVQLQVQCEEACKCSSERDSELSLLRDQYKESEKQKQDACQANTVLENIVSELRLKQKQKIEEYLQQLDASAEEKDALTTTLRTDRKAQQEALDDLQSALQQDVKTLQKEKEHLSFINQSLQRECDASQRLGAELDLKLKGQIESFRAIKEALQKKEMQNQELLEQLKAKAETVEHYKVQVEKAKTHYIGKKQQLLEGQKACRTLQASLETSEREGKALKAELKVVSMELGNSKASEKRLMAQIKSLETRLAYADHQIREQRKQGEQSVPMQHRENPRSHQAINGSSDSLELDLDDSLNAVGSKQSVPGESSTPSVRSSERLAAKRHTQGEGSLETLYFTPMTQERGKKRKDAFQDHKLESSISSLGELTLDSTRKPSSSVRRRRTTQVINITMTKKTPLGGSGAADADESFFSLHSAQSQPNLVSHKAHPVSEIFEDPNKLLSLPGYRCSNAHVSVLPRAPSTFGIGSEYEPDHFSDWMRIAELQSRNKSCLPHLKSSYPLESRPSLGFSHLPVTDEDVRTGDPTETIHRASTILSQLKDSIANHRLSLAPPAVAAHSQRATPVAKAREVRSTRSLLAPKRPAGQVQDLDTPEAKKLASCFPQTPKGRNLRSTNSQNIAPSPLVKDEDEDVRPHSSSSSKQRAIETMSGY
ncbi:nuclear mitotic apparatus protein 1-like isoform X3 [Tachysurus fulvidraco]|uniref:nuclear mitotic apparatus protein 1-like isoform X3 n=1 Tax=Tachysurus fulvidraco TaxID=1234273 RepID=UPI001FED9E5D|nr:nuclear mitotic apparatus protein 1-like isoform X3 [Tachysurus fulvidraco]